MCILESNHGPIPENSGIAFEFRDFGALDLAEYPFPTERLEVSGEILYSGAISRSRAPKAHVLEISLLLKGTTFVRMVEMRR